MAVLLCFIVARDNVYVAMTSFQCDDKILKVQNEGSDEARTRDLLRVKQT